MVLPNVAGAFVPLLFVLSNAARLPGDTVPLSYVLSVQPNYDRPSDTIVFDGQVNILIAVQNKSSVITLNYKNLLIYVVYLHESNTKQDIIVKDILHDPENERFQILLEIELEVDALYVLSIEYRGTNKNVLDGLYNSTYANPDGRDEWMLLTNLQTMGARGLFPCYDEPAYKTSYNISFTIPQFYTAQSNMPTYNPPYHDPGEVTFVETPPMSPHMVTLVASKFDWYSRTATDGNGPVRVFTHADYLDQVQYVAGEAPKLLKAMETFTGVRYDLPKLDLFAVPDFKTDAAGGWGLNTYREKFLLLNDVSSTKAKESGLSMVQGEIARQWFGNLVTCSWWDYLWLHDAFATYFKYFTVHSVYPNWRMDLLFVVEQHQSALTYDQTPRRPITGFLQSAEDINSAFYDQTYRKAAAVLRMLKYATDDDTFQQSLARYLDRNRYKSVAPDVLFAAFQSVIAERAFDFGRDFTVADFMKTWTEQAGYPVITVRKVNDKFAVAQGRFLIDMPDKLVDSNKWYIGITYTTESSKNFHNLTVASWCNPDVYECLLSAPPDPGWFIFNIQSTGLYRVNYDADNWRSLIGQLKRSHTDIDVLNRAQLIDDSFNLARADQLHYSVPLTLVSYLQREDDVLPWYSAINSYSYLLERMRRNTTEYTKLTECVSDLAGVIYKKTEDLVVYNGSTDHSTLTGWNAFSVWACGLDNAICIQSALEYFNKWLSGQIIPPDIRDTAFCIGIKNNSDPNLWQQMFSLYTAARSPSEKQSLQTALACTETVQLLRRYLNSIFVSKRGPIRTQDFNDVFIAVALTPTGLGELIDFLVENLQKIIKSFDKGDEIAVSIYSICASKAALDSEIIKLKELKDNSSTPQQLRKAFNESYHQVEQNLYWYEKYHIIVYKNEECYPEYITTDMPPIVTTKITSKTTTEATSTSHLTPESTTPIFPQTSTRSSTTSIQPETTTFVSSTISPENKTSTYTPKPTTPIYTQTTTSEMPKSTTTDYSTTSPENKTSTYTPEPSTSIYTQKTTQSETTSEIPRSTTTDYSTTSPENKTSTFTPEPSTPIYTQITTQSKTTSEMPKSTTTDYSTTSPENKTSTYTPEFTTPIPPQMPTQSSSTPFQLESTTLNPSTISPSYSKYTEVTGPTTFPCTQSLINITSVTPEHSTSYSQSSSLVSTTPAAFTSGWSIEKFLYDLSWVFIIVVAATVFMIFSGLIWRRSRLNNIYINTTYASVK